MYIYSVVGGIGGKQMTPLILNEAFLSKIRIIKVFFHVSVNPYIRTYISGTLDARGGRKL